MFANYMRLYSPYHCETIELSRLQQMKSKELDTTQYDQICLNSLE